jgi:hypothetical protein
VNACWFWRFLATFGGLLCEQTSLGFGKVAKEAVYVTWPARRIWNIEKANEEFGLGIWSTNLRRKALSVAFFIKCALFYSFQLLA